MRAPVDTIAAPLFPTKLPWVNTTGPQATIQRGRPMLVEFWDFCRPNSIRTLPYLKAWNERYAADGLRVIGVHSPGFEPARDEQAVREAVARLGIAYPVLIDSELVLGRGRLFDYHYGEGAYAETELAIGELLGVEREPLGALRPEDEPGVALVVPSADREGPYSGPYEAGGVWGVFAGRGSVRVNGSQLTLPGPGAYPLVEHRCHTVGALELLPGPGVSCLATCFTPGVAV